MEKVKSLVCTAKLQGFYLWNHEGYGPNFSLLFYLGVYFVYFGTRSACDPSWPQTGNPPVSQG
jgi:hypothetical protein